MPLAYAGPMVECGERICSRSMSEAVEDAAEVRWENPRSRGRCRVAIQPGHTDEQGSPRVLLDSGRIHGARDEA